MFLGSDLGFGVKKFFCSFWLIFTLGSGSLDPHIFADPDSGSQNLADPTNPDPYHWILYTIIVLNFTYGYVHDVSSLYIYLWKLLFRNLPVEILSVYQSGGRSSDHDYGCSAPSDPTGDTTPSPSTSHLQRITSRLLHYLFNLHFIHFQAHSMSKRDFILLRSYYQE